MTDDLVRVVHGARRPHGYTLATWGAGVLCIDKYGLPDLGGVLLFVSGATSALWWHPLDCPQQAGVRTGAESAAGRRPHWCAERIDVDDVDCRGIGACAVGMVCSVGYLDRRVPRDS